MNNNQCQVYEYIKKSWRDDARFVNFAEVRKKFPDHTEYALSEGMIEFQIAFKHSFKHEIDDWSDEKVKRMLESAVDLLA